MASTFSIHFDGPITRNHKVSVRVLARTYEHMQRSIDRAYLTHKYGSVWKHARLKQADYAETDFIAEYPREGGIILDCFKEGAAAILDRLNSAIVSPFEQALNQGEAAHTSIVDQLPVRVQQAHARRGAVPTYQEMLNNPDERIVRAYSDRSIVKEIDQIAALVTPDELHGSTVAFQLYGSRAHPVWEFDAEQAHRFHQIVSRREL
jgi:hypothetical protein